MRFDELKQAMASFDTLEVGRGASELDIRTAENALNLRILGDYRAFLRDYGWGGVGYLELYGLGEDVPNHLNLVNVTRSERIDMVPRLRKDLLPIMNDGAGNLYCLDTTSDGPRIVFWNHEEPESQIPTVESNDFATWFGSQIDAMK